MPPFVSITANTVELVVMLKSVKGVEFSLSTCVPLSIRNGPLLKDGTLCLTAV